MDKETRKQWGFRLLALQIGMLLMWAIWMAVQGAEDDPQKKAKLC